MTHAGSSLTLAPFHLKLLFCFCFFFLISLFNEFPLVFPDTAHERTVPCYCLRVSWTCSRSEASCLRSSRGGIYGEFVCVCAGLIVLESPNNAAPGSSLLDRDRRRNLYRAEGSAVTTTAAIFGPGVLVPGLLRLIRVQTNQPDKLPPN